MKSDAGVFGTAFSVPGNVIIQLNAVLLAWLALCLLMHITVS